MGGAAPVESGKSGKKTTDVEINLVPFIDLLSCLIAFLLISAVWTQITSLRVSQTGGLSDATPPEDDVQTIDIRVTMTDRGYQLSLAGNVVELPKVTREKVNDDGIATNKLGFDVVSLADKLKVVKANYQAQRAVTVAAEDAILYEDLIETVDSIVAQELPDISVTAAVN